MGKGKATAVALALHDLAVNRSPGLSLIVGLDFIPPGLGVLKQSFRFVRRLRCSRWIVLNGNAFHEKVREFLARLRPFCF